MVTFVMIAVGITCLNMLNQFAAVYLTSGASHLAAFDGPQLQALAAAFLDLHQAGYRIAQVFFGLWLLPLGFLVYRSGFLPRLIGVLLMIACLGYLADVVTFFLAPGFGVVFSEFTFVGELALMGWLVVRGVNVTRWQSSGFQSARRPKPLTCLRRRTLSMPSPPVRGLQCRGRAGVVPPHGQRQHDAELHQPT